MSHFSRNLVCAAAVILTLSLAKDSWAFELEVDGGFSSTNAAAFPTGWCWHDTWAGYLPVATAQVVRVDGGNVLHYYGAGGSEGCVLRSRRRHVGLRGDIVTLTFEAKGSGTLWYSFYRYTAKGGWIGGVPAQSVALTDAWCTYSASFTLTEISGLSNGLFETVLGIRPGADAYVRNLHVTRILETTEGIDCDDFETQRTRLGNPTIVQGDIAPGLLSQTSMGRYTTSSQKTVSSSQLTLPPADARHFVQTSYRLYDFGSPVRTDADLVTTLAAQGSNFVFNLHHEATSDSLRCTFDGGGEISYPYAKLPADFTLSVSADGYYELAIRSLSDSSVVRTSGLVPFLACGTNGLARTLTLAAGAGSSVVTLDEISTAYAMVQCQTDSVFPYTAEPEPTFDPVAAGWDLVFSDEFDGTDVDTGKWTWYRPENADLAILSNGVLHIRTEYNQGANTLRTASLWSREGFTYGYFEARLKFTTYNGWWAAFWLCSDTSGNPFVDGMEIDIFEDYYMRNPERNKLDHNLHMRGGALKSWNYNSILPGTHHDWYTIACKWTPFEITYYLNGKALPASAKVAHSPYDTVTFDAFRHGTGICPLHAIVSGQIMSTAYGYHEDDEGEVFPEDFLVDYVRVYAYPPATNGVAPTVTMKSGAGGNYSVPSGSMMDFRVTPRPGENSSAAIKAVHLFDNGYHIATKTNEPYVFSFPMSEEFYAKTRWMNPGRQSVRPDFAGSLHVFSAFAEDEDGNVGHSDTISYLLEPTQPTTPYEGIVPTLPGAVKVGRYDEGGEGVSYHDDTEVHAQSTTWRQDSTVDGAENVISSISSGEWVTYTVNVLSSGWYTVRMTYGSPYQASQHIDVLLDGLRIADIPIRGHASAGFGTDTTSEARVKLPSGRHVLKLVFFGTFNFAKLEFEKLPDPGETYEWTGEAGDGNWKNVSNWAGRTWGWDFPYAGDTAYFPTNATIVGDLAFDEGRLTLTNDVGTSLTFKDSISGPVGIDKRGGGDLHLKADNPFAGGFTTLGINNCEWSVGTRGFSCSVYAYAGGSLGRGKAFFDCDGRSHGSRLHLMSPMTVVNEIQLSADGIQQGNLVYHRARNATFTFRERLTTNERFVDSYISDEGAPKTVVFEKGVSWSSWSFCNSGIEYVFGAPSSFSVLLAYANATVRFQASGNDIPTMKLGGGNVRYVCEAENALGRTAGRAATIEFGASNAFVDMDGHDQIVSNLNAFIQSAGVTNFGFHSPVDAPAMLRLRGNAAAQPGFRGKFTGAAGLEWAPSNATREFVFSNTTFATAGELSVLRGRIIVADGASVRFGRLSLADGTALSLAAGTTFECDELWTNGVRVAEGRYLSAGVGASVSGPGYLAVGPKYRFFTVVRPVAPTAVETTAFRELTNYIDRATGVLPLTAPEDGVIAGPALYVGATAFAAANGVDVTAMEEEAWRVKSVGRDLVVAGGGRRGTLYGVYHYLEDVLGVHWFAPTSDGDCVPSLDAPPTVGLDLAGQPRMRYRTIYYVPGKWSTEFQARNRANTSSSTYGGFKIFGGVNNCHTLYTNIGASNEIVQLFRDFPEYFPLRDGVRYCDTSRANSAAQSQFCLTSPGLRALWTKRLRARMLADIESADRNGMSRPLYYAIDQNDCYDGFCKCPQCQAIVDREGSNAGLMLDFANDIATRLKDVNPDARFMMMALHSSETPPTYMTASNNVIIRLCDTTSDILRPWTNAVNAAHFNNLEGWTAHADKMSMWDYSVTYGSISSRCLPVPTEFTYGPDIRTLWEHKGEGFFIEHEDVIASDFRDGKVWMELRLLEDPTLDPEALFTLFTDGCYGAAGPFVRQYRRRLQEAALASGNKVIWFPNLAAHSYLTPDVLLELYDIRSNAVAAVASDETLRHRVEYAFLSLDRIRIVRALYYNRQTARLPGGERLISNVDAIARYTRVFSERREKLGLKAGCSEEKDGLTNFVEAVENSIELPIPDQFRDVEADLTLIPAAKASLSYAPVTIVPDASSPASNVVRVAIADVRANPVASAPTTYLAEKFGYPFHASISPLHAGSLLAPSARERFTAADAPIGYRWYLIQENVRLAQSSAVSPFPGCSIPLDGVVGDNSELGQRYDVYLSIKATGSDWWRVGPPADDMVVFVDQVAVVCKKKNGEKDPYQDARIVAWTGHGRTGDWNDAANWQGGVKPGDGEIAFFGASATITSDFALPETRLMISNAAGATVTLDCRVSGRGGLDKRGDGELKLMRDNDFEGAFTSRGTIDAQASTAISSPVQVYAGGAFGRRAAYFDADYANGHGSRLKIMGPMDITVPVQLTGDRKQVGGISFSNVTGRRVRFLKRVWSDFRMMSSTTPSGADIVFEDGVECPNFLMPPYHCCTRFNGRVAGTLYLASGATCTNRLAYAGNAIVALNLNSGVLCCETENVLYNPSSAMTISFGANTLFDLGGHDQTVCALGKAIEQGGDAESNFAIHSPIGRPASLRLVGAVPTQPGFRGCFTGSAGFVWSPAESTVFVFSNTVQTTCGTVEVGSGTVRVKCGAGFSKLASLSVAAAATFDVAADAAPVRVADLTVAAGGRLALAKADAVSARHATVGGEALTNGVYAAADLPDVISGDGTLVVGALENVWTGTSSSDWSDPRNWSRGASPAEGEYVTLPSGAHVRLASGVATPRLASFAVEAGATLVCSNWNTAVCADDVTIAGTVTADGPFATEADDPQARVWFICDSFNLQPAGVIDVDGKGWAVACGPGTPGGSTCGAAHGGAGGITTVGTSDGKLRFGCVYDDAEEPCLPGSGGAGKNGSAGGGAVRIEATSVAVVDGRILASAKAAASATAGSGGSIYIAAKAFSGSGELRADGGNGASGVYPAFVWAYLGEANNNGARAGGGGRIAIACEPGLVSSAYEGLVVSAAAGLHQGLTVGNHDKFRTEADLGTLVFGDMGIVRATLGKGLSGRLVRVSDYRHEGDLVWTAGHVRFAGDGADVTVTGDLTVSGLVSRAEIGGLYTRTNVGVFADCWGGTNQNRLTVGGNLKLLDGAALDIRAAATNATMAWGGEVNVSGDFLVGSGSYLYPWCEIKNLGAPHFAVGGSFTVEPEATVMADRRGGMGGRGGSGWKSYFCLGASAEAGFGLGHGLDAGASHGGRGGLGYQSAANRTSGTAGALVGDEWSAAFPGAGGGSGGYGEGGEGGGLVYVEAGGRIRIDGLVTADGWLGTYSGLGSGTSNSGYCTYFGSGAGGGIHLKGRQIYGTGVLRARGGNAISGYADANATYGYASGAGGGGRIFVELRSQHPQFAGTTDVSGGHAVWNAAGKSGDAVQFPAAVGGEGTVRYRLSDNPCGTRFLLR